jgi:hypothetical protein
MSTPSTPPAEALTALANPRFPNLSQAEHRLLRAAPKGEFAVCGPSKNDDDPANDPAKANNKPEAGGWGADREIRADLIRWLCTDPEAIKTVDPRGVRVYAAKISGGLDLSYATVPLPLLLCRCNLANSSDFQRVKLPLLDLNGTYARSINMDGANVTGSIFLVRLKVEGEVRLIGAQIGGNLECDTAILKSPGGSALSADSADIRGNVFLRAGFSAAGEVDLLGAQIGGDLDCGGGTFENPGGAALKADRANIKGAVFLKYNFSSEGEVRLIGAQIGGNLECDTAILKNAGGLALNADSADIKGNVFLRDNFSAEGAVRLNAAHITGTLEIIAWKNAWPAILDLTGAAVGYFLDEKKSWPNKGNLGLDGFVYRVIAVGPTDARSRLAWLDLQPGFKPQPYRQLAKFLREQGDDDGAKQVLFELERRTRAEDRSKLPYSPARLFQATDDLISESTVGYGIYPGRAAWFLGGITILSWIVHRRAELARAMAPTEEDAYKEFRDSDGHTPAHYPPFNPFIYSLENCLPLVKFGQDDRWQPDPNPRSLATAPAPARWSRSWFKELWFVPTWALSPPALRWFRWFMIAAGWFLATFFVAAVSGIIKPGWVQ